MQYKIVQKKSGEVLIYKREAPPDPCPVSPHTPWERVPGMWLCWEDAEKQVMGLQELSDLDAVVREETYNV